MSAPTVSDTPRVWVGCLSCYNAGRLMGGWVAAVECADFIPCIRAGHEEWWVMDHEGFGPMLAGECSPMEAQQIAEQLATFDDDDQRAAFAAFIANDSSYQGDFEQARAAFDESYHGRWATLAEFVEQWYEDVCPDLLDRMGGFSLYVDWSRVAHDFDCLGWWTAPAHDFDVFVFEPI